MGNWTHPICDLDYDKLFRPGGAYVRTPVRMYAEPATRELMSEPCCWCGEMSRGIYVRAAPDSVPRCQCPDEDDAE